MIGVIDVEEPNTIEPRLDLGSVQLVQGSIVLDILWDGLTLVPMLIW